MSDDLLERNSDRAARKRALWILLVIALVAAILVSLMAFLLGTSGGKKNSLPPATAVGLDPNATPTATASSAPSHHASPSGHAHSSGTNLASPTTSAAPGSCPTSSPCALPGDPGQVVVALNKYRAQHALAPVTGGSTAAAQTCAVNDGNTGSCPFTYYWEPVSAQNGQQVITKVIGNGGSSFLLSSTLKSVNVGWAYVPSSKSYECTIAAG